MLGLGGYPLVSLAEAREAAVANRKRARAGGDPLAERRHRQGVPTAEEAAAAVLAQQRPGWRNAKHAREWPRSLRAYAFPRLGALSVSMVTTADVLAILTPIWHDKPETARRVRQRLGAVMKWAVAMGYRQDNPAGDALGQALGRQQVVVQHMRALPHGAVADALATVRASQAAVTTKDAFEFLVLTATRSGEVRLAIWDEMDLAAGVWTILRCRRGPEEWRGCPASGGLGAWRNHSEYRHSQRLSFRIVTDAARVFPLPRWSPRAVRTSHQMDRSESPCTHVAAVHLLDPGGTVKGPTTHLVGVWFRSSSITTNEPSGAMATRSMRPPRLVSPDQSPSSRARGWSRGWAVLPSPAVP